MSQENVDLISGKELKDFISEALTYQSIKALFDFSGVKATEEFIEEAEGAKYKQNSTTTKVLTLKLDQKKTMISLTLHGRDIKATSTVYSDNETFGYQAVGENVYPIVSTKAINGSLVHEWHKNPIFDVEGLPESTPLDKKEVKTSRAQISSCGLCSNICGAIQTSSCGLGGTAGCMVVCAGFAGLACPFICAGIWGLKCWGDGVILCGPICEQLGYC
ncbi:hypothetical protein [Virgibacillus salexigens]|uniref:Uncharacterized protein n=1 Tax=Virgibacillus kapii TaxID=1638645 RepID=A0ABQ2DYR5_9BACI|nr:hypothetical protein [Virgibacillus kapii]GGJ77249.1 hypothetical protein GCM10007111_43560 [Virgibacillus kapii]